MRHLNKTSHFSTQTRSVLFFNRGMTASNIPFQLRGDFEQCAQIARRHYENFPVASFLLPSSMRPHVAALYAFARTADDFADEPIYEGNRMVELDRWEREFRLALEGKPSNPVAKAFAYSVQTHGIPPELPLRLLTAFRMDVEVKRWKDWDTLFDYCRHSADPVGRSVLYLAGVKDEKLHLLSDKVCTGLQLINFWQDTTQDLTRGRIYYPKSEWKSAEMKEEAFRPGADDERTKRLVRKVLDLTEEHFRSGFPLADQVPSHLARELRATFAGGLALIGRIRALDYCVFTKRPKLNLWDKMRLGHTAFFGKTPSPKMEAR
jgi:squalene synthase HpnC